MQIEDYIVIEQTKAVYGNTVIVVLGFIGVSLVTAFMFWEQTSLAGLHAWLVAAVVIVTGRLATLKVFRSKKVGILNSQFWLNTSMLWSFITGVHWGIVPTYFLSAEATFHTLFVSIVYTGHLASAISSNSAYSRGFFAVGIPTTLCFAGRFFYEGGGFYNTIGIMVVIFFGISALLSRNSEKLFREARELNFKNMTLMKELVIQKDAAELATRSKDSFLAAASHDLRQPLHASGLLLSALEEYVTDPRGKGLLHDIRLSGEALNHSFSSLLDVSRLNAGVIESRPRHVNLQRQMYILLRDGNIQAREKGLNFDYFGEEIAVHTDPALFERVINNLVSNAVTYTHTGGIAVSWLKSGSRYARILIQDTGIGIDQSHLLDVFSEYYQIDNPERDREKGFGLGLVIVQRLCTILNINLYLSSQPDTGTVFALYIPLGDLDRVIEKTMKTKLIGSLRNLTVLVIDDDQSVCRSMDQVLTSWGCRVLTACSQSEAVAQMETLDEPLDLIIADYRLREGKTGTDAIEFICDELNESIPAIIITGDTSPERLKMLRDSGFPVLHKPVTAAAIRAAIQRQIMVSKTA